MGQIHVRRSEPPSGHESVVRQGRALSLDADRLRDSCQRLASRQKVGSTGIGLQKSLRSLGLMIYPPCEGGDQSLNHV